MKKTHYTDPGHGWLAVKAKELVELGIANNISSYSYINGKTVYLEEDSDAPRYLDACRAKNIEITIVRKHHERTPIRYYKSYTSEGIEQ
jgi:hypothetical protein